MESNCGISKLLELIFDRKPTIPDKMFAHLSIPSSLLNQDFSKKLDDVMSYKKRIYSFYFKEDFDEAILHMMDSKESYLKIVLTACRDEFDRKKNAFEKFLNVCAVVKFLSEEMFQKTGVNFCDLNPDIIIMYYQCDVNKSPFRKHFSQFVDFIWSHRYFKWNWDTFDHTSPDGGAASCSLDKRIKEETDRFRPILEEVDFLMIATLTSIAEKILSNTSVELPSLPSKSVLVERLDATRKKEMAKQTKGKGRGKSALTNETSHGNASSNSDSKQMSYAAQEESTEWHESIVQAVTRHNHSNIPRLENAKNKKQTEADGFLEHLKTSIESLIEVLDECVN